jgi:hypothetical protein
VHQLERVQPLGERGAEVVEAETPAVLGALGPRLSAPGPAIQLGRHDAEERNNRGQRLSIVGPA